MGVSAAIAIVGGAMAADQHENNRVLRKEGKKEVKRQEAQLASEKKAIEDEQLKGQRIEDNAATIRRQRAMKSQKAGRAGTILTGGAEGSGVGSAGLGNVGQGQKTLLGT